MLGVLDTDSSNNSVTIRIYITKRRVTTDKGQLPLFINLVFQDLLVKTTKQICAVSLCLELKQDMEGKLEHLCVARDAMMDPVKNPVATSHRVSMGKIFTTMREGVVKTGKMNKSWLTEKKYSSANINPDIFNISCGTQKRL